MSEIHPRLYLISPVIEDAEIFAPTLQAAFEGGRIDSLWLRLTGVDEREQKTMVQRLSAIAQEAGAAVVIDPPGDARLAARMGVDGVHMRYDEAALRQALDAHHPDRVVGVGGLRSRDEAMIAGEAGVDYVMFGEPYPDGVLPEFSAVNERVSWWAQTFLTPCVAYAPTLAEVRPLAKARAEFIALAGAVWDAPDGPAAAVTAALAAIAKVQPKQ